jgi:predicted PurR-regulated permease PerM
MTEEFLMRRNHLSRFSRVLLTGVAAAAVAAPVASAARADLVQVGGQLVAPSELSSVELGLGKAESTRLAQIGGELVRPSQLSSWQRNASSSTPAISTEAGGSSSFSWRDAGAGAGGATAAILVLASTVFVFRRRRSIATA